MIEEREFEVTTPVNDFIRKSLSHKKPYMTSKPIKGKYFYCHPFVVSPEYSYAPQFFSDYWEIKEDDTVLDIGSGCGILAILAAEIAEKVVASDINPYSLECIRENMRIHNASIDLRIGNMFEVVREGEKFTKILFNAPYFNEQATNELEIGLFDKDYKVMGLFLEGAMNHLTEDGLALVGFSELGEVDTVEGLIRKNEYSIADKKVETFGHTRILYYLTHE